MIKRHAKTTVSCVHSLGVAPMGVAAVAWRGDTILQCLLAHVIAARVVTAGAPPRRHNGPATRDTITPEYGP